MAVRTKEEIIASLNSIFGDNNSDDVLNILTDVSDTLGSATDAQRITELENQLAQQDANWRKKYRDAFLSGADEPDEPDKPKKPKKFEDLFSVQSK